MDEVLVTESEESAGCDSCLAWSSDFIAAFKQEPQMSTNGAFEVSGGYFSADLVPCEVCGTTWLAGYVEDFSGRPIEAEWGDRWWTIRALTSDLLKEIESARGTNSLDLKSFAAHRPGCSWEQ